MSSRRVLLSLTGVAAVFALALATSAFSGESAAVKTLLDFLLRKDLMKVGDELIAYLMDLCQRYFLFLLVLNPDPLDPITLGITKYVMAVLEPLFVLALLSAGLYLIFFSGNPDVRSKIKTWIPGVIGAMVLVMLSPHIINILFYVSRALCSSVLSQWGSDPFKVILPADKSINPVYYFLGKFQGLTWYSSEAASPFLFIALLILGGLFTAIVARYILLSLFLMVFPLTIFLYLFLPTREVGKRLMEQTIVWTFMQVIEATAVICIATVITVFAGYLPADILVLLQVGGILVLIAVPVASVLYVKDFLPG
jgi:hypothetical protein